MISRKLWEHKRETIEILVKIVVVVAVKKERIKNPIMCKWDILSALKTS
jgi:hypothetical protein